MSQDYSHYRNGVCAVFLLLFVAARLHSQTSEADSLKRILREEMQSREYSDTAIIHRLNAIAYSVRNTVHDTALVYANEALIRSKRMNYLPGQARALMISGIVAIYEGHYNAGLDLHIQALDIYRALRDSVQEAFLLNNIGYLYKSQGNIPIAKEYFAHSLQIFRSIHFSDGESLVLGNLGDIALKRSEYAEALRLEKESLAFGLRSKDPFYGRIALFHLGTIFHAMEQHDSALSYQTQALKNFQGDGLGQYIVRSLENIAAIYASQKQYGRAFEAAERGLSIADSIGSSIDMALMNERLSVLYATIGRHDKALEYYRRTTSLRDSLTSLNIEQRIKSLDLMRVAEKSSKELALAEKEQAGLESLRNILIAGISFVTILLFLLWSRNRYIARSEAVLRDVNSRIMSQQLQLAEQSNMIREANAALSVTNLELDAKNEHLTSTNARLEIANERLAALNNEKDELLGIVAHDLKNPLTTIMMASSSLASSVVLPDRVAILGARILHTSERMLSIITKLLNLNALEQGATKLNIRSVNVVETVKAIVEEHRIHAQSKGIDVKLMNTNSSIILATDESLIAEIVENLLDNALKYSPKEKRVWIRMEEVMKGDSRKKWLELRVQDEGQGFSEEDKTKVFGKFVRLSAKPTDGEESTGLGLSIVKRLAEMLGGTIALESEKEQGATFILVLPSLEL